MTRSDDTKHHTPVFVYDFTFFGLKNEEFPTPEEFIKSLQPWFKRWIFQTEKCPTTDRLHYQGRGSLIKKKRHGEFCTALNQSDLKGMDISESSNESKSREIFYMMKEETRVDGPWDDSTYKPPPYIPRQYQGLIDRLHPWQKTVLDSRSSFNERCIDVIVDTRGNRGKSTLAALGRLHHGALDLPPIGDHKELLQIVCDTLSSRQERHPGLVFVDCPRSLDQKRMAPYFIAIEQIKKGYVCDVRYHYKEWDFDSPRVWVFMNREPDPKYLSRDRWNYWQINAFNMLETFVPKVPES